MRDLIIAGVPMRDVLGKWGIDYTRSSLFSQLSRRLTSDDRIGYHGVDAEGPDYFGAAQDTLVLNCLGSDKDDFNQHLGFLQSLFAQRSFELQSAPQRSPLDRDAILTSRLDRTFIVDSDALKVAPARMVGSLAIERVNEKAARVTAIVERPDAFWQGSSQLETSATVLSTTSHDVELTEAADSTAPIIDGIIRLRGPFAAGVTVTIRDRGSVDSMISILMGEALLATDYLLIDVRTLQCWQAGDTWVLAGTDRRSWLSLSAAGGFTFSPDWGGPMSNQFLGLLGVRRNVVSQQNIIDTDAAISVGPGATSESVVAAGGESGEDIYRLSYPGAAAAAEVYIQPALLIDEASRSDWVRSEFRVKSDFNGTGKIMVRAIGQDSLGNDTEAIAIGTADTAGQSGVWRTISTLGVVRNPSTTQVVTRIYLTNQGHQFVDASAWTLDYYLPLVGFGPKGYPTQAGFFSGDTSNTSTEQFSWEDLPDVSISRAVLGETVGFPEIPNRYWAQVTRDGSDITSEVAFRLTRSYLS